MNRSSFAAFCLVLLLIPAAGRAAPAYRPAQQSPITGAVAVRSANVRSGPSTNATILATLAQGQVVAVTGRNADASWIAVRLPSGQEGWMAARLLRLSQAVDQAPLRSAGTARRATPTPTPAGTRAQLVAVVDGDTIDVTVDGRPETVRYIGVDTPERGQPGYQAATEANRRLLGAGSLLLAADVSDRDRYGRLLRYVTAADGTLVNQALVSQGWAQPVSYPPDTRLDAALRAAAQDAARARRGFWSGAATEDGVMPYGLASTAARVRQGPGTGFGITTTAAAGTPLTVFGRTPAGDWLQVRLPDRAGGWVSASLVALNVPASAVPVARDIPAVPGGDRAAPAPVAPTPAPVVVTGACDPSYPDVCIPSPPPDLDCRDVPYRNFRVAGPDPHRFDGDHDGVGCEQ